jgi:hypothetical protein
MMKLHSDSQIPNAAQRPSCGLAIPLQSPRAIPSLLDKRFCYEGFAGPPMSFYLAQCGMRARLVNQWIRADQVHPFPHA